MEPRLKSFYKSQILPELKNSLGVKNTMQVPKVLKIVINMGLGLDANDNKILKNIETDLANITGQKPVITKSKKAISNFKTRANIPLGLKVTLRKNNMYYFLDRLINIALPRIKDFRGLNPKSFDENANYSFGIKEHVIFPEVNFDKVDKIRGLDITIVIKSNSKEHSLELLKKFNFPFREERGN
jgi:large subunit ribosomal protein L5